MNEPDESIEINIEIEIPEAVINDLPKQSGEPLSADEEDRLTLELIALQSQLFNERDGSQEIDFLIDHFMSPAMGDAAMAMAGAVQDEDGALEPDRLRRAIERLREGVEHVKWFKANPSNSIGSVKQKLQTAYDELMGEIKGKIDFEDPDSKQEFAEQRYRGGTLGSLLEQGEVNKQTLALIFLHGDEGKLQIDKFRSAYEDVMAMTQES